MLAKKKPTMTINELMIWLVNHEAEKAVAKKKL